MARLISDNDPLARQVRLLAQRQAIPHAVILTGGDEPLSAARYLAAAMLCRGDPRPCLHCTDCRKVCEGIHPDVTVVQEESRRELAVEDIRLLRQDVYIRPNEGERKVYIFSNCAQLNERDQNVLLKIVEEGPAYASFLFCAHSAAQMLPTIRSRCVELKARADAPPAPAEAAVELCRAAASGQALPVVQLLVSWETRHMKREQLERILRDAWRLCADALVRQRSGLPGDDDVSAALCGALRANHLQKLTDTLRHYAQECRYNVGPGHVLGALAACWETILH